MQSPHLSLHHRLALLLFILNSAAKPAAQPTPAPTTAPPPLNLTAVLEKGGQFTTLIRLLQSTQLDQRIKSQLNNSNSGLTLFAPSDNAFSSLSPGTLNKLNSEQQVALLEYHIIPTLITLSDFQTVSNPLSTQAGDSSPGQYPLNVTTDGNRVNISTGLVNTTISGVVYSDSELEVYRVDEVLLPMGVFRPSVPVAQPRVGVNGSDPAAGPDASGLTDVSFAGQWGRDGFGFRVGVVVVGVGLFWWRF